MVKNAKLVPFFYKEWERAQRTPGSFLKNGKERVPTLLEKCGQNLVPNMQTTKFFHKYQTKIIKKNTGCGKNIYFIFI